LVLVAELREIKRIFSTKSRTALVFVMVWICVGLVDFHEHSFCLIWLAGSPGKASAPVSHDGAMKLITLTAFAAVKIGIGLLRS
jgi:hypothetical protein